MTELFACPASRVPRAGVSLSSPHFDGRRSQPRSLAASQGFSAGKRFAVLAVMMLAGALGVQGQVTLEPEWIQLSPPNSPQGRYIHALTYDAGHRQVVLFGGFTQTSPYNADDTWLWDGTTWTQANPATSPDARDAHAMTYDAGHGNVVMFGGTSLTTIRFGDTWLWNGTNWTQANPATSPTARSAAVMVYYPPQNNVLLFGGSASSGVIGDTWTWDGTNWSAVTPASSPSARGDYSMAYDAATGNIVLFGGNDAAGDFLGDTWIWNGTTWTQQSPANNPPARSVQAMAYDPDLGEVVMWGGENSNGFLNDTWAWNGSNWTELNSASSPAGRYAPNAITYDAAQNELILFSGQTSNQVFDDTWAFTTSQNFGNVNVCSSGAPAPCSVTQTLTYSVATTTTFGTTQVVTQGAAGLDFSLASGSTCTGTVSAGNTCTVNVTFAPGSPGLRQGAVELFSSASSTTPVTTTLIYGMGEAPLAAYSPLTSYVQNTGSQVLNSPQGVAVDAAGDLFIANTGADNVVEVAANGTATTVGAGLNFPESVAVDGAGDVFVGQFGPSVTEIPVGCTQQTCEVGLGSVSAATAVAVDAAGDVFIGDQNLGEVVEVPTSNPGSQIVLYSPGGAFAPAGLAVDAAGDLYIADNEGGNGQGKVLMIPAGGATPTPVFGGWNHPNSVTLDAAGDLYVADSGLQEVVEVPAGCASGSCQIIAASGTQPSLGSNFSPYGVAVDSRGDLYIADFGLNRVDAVLQSLYSVGFSESSVGNISGDSPQSIVLQNIGNAGLNATNPGLLFTNPSFYQVSGSGTPGDCTTAFSLAPGSTCNVSIDFDPLTSGLVTNTPFEVTGYALFVDNSLNNTSSSQSIALTGQSLPSGTEYLLTVTDGGIGSGSVTDNMSAITCSESGGSITGACSANYASGAQVTLTAAATAGSTFAGWGAGACATAGTSSTCTVTMSQALDVSANFAPGNFGAANVCPSGATGPAPCSSTFNVTYTFPPPVPSVGEVTALTDGVVSKEFQANSLNCAGNTCTVSITFRPQAPGLRRGAVEFLDATGAVLYATELIYGIGQAPEAAFGPTVTFTHPLTPSSSIFSSSQVSEPPNLAGPLMTDAAGNLYQANSTILQKLAPPYTGTPTTVATGFSNPLAGAIDGAGNLYIADGGIGVFGEVLKIAPGCTSISCATVLYAPTVHPNVAGVAVDGSGDVFIADNPAGVLELPANGGSMITLYNPGGGSAPASVAVDAVGDLFVADTGLSKVVEIPPGCTTAGCQINIGSGWSSPASVTVDAAGDVIVADFTLTIDGQADAGGVVEVPAGCTTSACQILLLTLGAPDPYAVALSPLGQLFVATDGGFLEINLSQTPAVAFDNVTVGQNAVQTVTMQNIGNETLSSEGVSGVTVSGTYFTGYSSTPPPPFCSGGAPFEVAPGQLCDVGILFGPATPGARIGTAVISDNVLNGAPATQTITLSGVGVSGGPTNYPLTVTEAGSGFGTVTDNLSTINCSVSNPAGCSASYASGTNVTLQEIPSAGSTFAGWGGACSGTYFYCTVPVSAATSVTATFVQGNFGGVSVCQPGGATACTPTTQGVTFNIPAGTTIGAVQVVTQGATGLDFQLGSGSTCTPAFVAPGLCSVNVNFTPLAPGLRMGAVELYTSAGNLIASTPISGVGQAPAAAFGPGTQAIVTNSGLNYPVGVALDGAGNLYIANYGSSVHPGYVSRIAPGGTQSTVLSTYTSAPSQPPQPIGVAVDGAGNLYIVDLGLPYAVELTPAGIQSEVGSGLNFPTAIALDAAGNVYIADQGNKRVVEVTPGNVQSTVPVSGLLQPWGVAVDAAGDLFIADGDSNATPTPLTPHVVEYSATGIQSTVPVTGLSRPYHLVVDAAGDLFIADFWNSRVVEYSATGTQTIVGSGLGNPSGVTVDPRGDVYIGDQGNQTVYEVNRSQVPSFNFATTNLGATSADSPQLVSVQNVGNQTLSVSVSAPSTANFVENPSGSNCGTTTPSILAAGASCSESFGFTPQNTGILNDSASFSDNTFNLSSSVVLQTVNLTGIGSLNGATGTFVPNVVGMTEAAATTALTDAGLGIGAVGSQYSSSQAAGSVIGQSPVAGSQVSLGSKVGLMISTGEAPPLTANPLNFENNFFVTGDYATAGVTLRTVPPVSGMASGTITIPDLTGCNCGQGVPDGADLVEGYLYWTSLENTPAPSGNTGTFLGISITGQQVGSDVPNYSDGTNTGTLRVYRADVNAYFQVQPNWNGERLGSGPFAVSFPDVKVAGGQLTIPEGASLVVIYRALVAPGSTGVAALPLKSVVIYDGSAVPAASTTQTIQGFYDAVGGANGTGEVTTLYAAGGGWNDAFSTPTLGASSQYNAPLSAGNAYAAIILSTPVNNSDNDGILDVWKAGPAAPDFFAGQPGYYDVKTQSWVSLPGAKRGNKDLFVQLDYMCGAVLANGQCDPSQENLFPSPDSNGNDPLAMVQQAFAQTGVTLHLEVGNAVPESTCTDSNSQLCEFPGEPGVVGWKNSLEFSKLWPRNFASCAAGGDCTARFPYGQKDSYHYVLFGHSLAIPAWNSRFGTLAAISVANGVTTITTTDRGTGINECPSRITISGVLSNPTLDGVYNTSSCPDTKTIIVSTPGVLNWTYSYATNTPPEPTIGLTSSTVTSISGYSDLGGADSAVTLALWETSPNQDMSKRAQVIAGTLFHEIGHTLGLSHGGIYFNGGSGSYVPTFDVNCKPNYQSAMNYLFQLGGVGPDAAVAYSSQTLETLAESSLNSVTNLLDINNNPAKYSTSSWYSPTLPANSTESAATLHCDGTTLTGDTGYLVQGAVAPITPPWSAGQNITFDGVPPLSSGLLGYNDVANMDLRQTGATGGEFASLASVISFGNATAPLNVAPGGSVNVGAGGIVNLAAGGSVTLASGGSATVGSGAVINGGGTITLSTGGSAMLSATGSITPGSNGVVTFPNGGALTLSTTGTITVAAGVPLTLPNGGNVTLSGGGTITLPLGAGTVTIPSIGGSYTIPAGGAVTLGGGGAVTLGGGGAVTLGAGGAVTLGAGGAVTLGGGGAVTLGAGGAVTLGGGGAVTLGAGGAVTLGGGGTITLSGGGAVTLGGGGAVTLGAGGAVTLGGGGAVTLGAGGAATLGAGGTVTVAAGGSLTLPAGGAVTLGAGGVGTVSGGGMCSGSCNIPAGGTLTLTSGGTVTLTAGGAVTLGGGGAVTLGGGGAVTLGGGGAVTLGGGGAVTLGGGGATSVEMNYDTANSVVRPPVLPTYTVNGPGSIQVSWMAPAFGVVQSYTISRSDNGGAPVVIGTVSSVNGFPPVTTFTDTNPPAGTLVYTIATTLVPDSNGSQRQSSPSPPAVLTLNQAIVFGALQSSYAITSSPVTVTATAETNGTANLQLVSFSATGSCSVGDSTLNTTAGASYGASTASVTLTGTGGCTITASQTGNIATAQPGSTAYNPATSASATFSIVLQNSGTTPQVINFPQLPSLQYGKTFTLNATNNSGLPITYTPSGPCTATGTTSGIGMCSIKASAPAGQGPNNTMYGAASVTQSFTVYPAVLTVTAGNLTSPYGTIPSLTNDYTITGFVNGESASVLSGTAPALSTTATSTSNPAIYPISVAMGSLAASNYTFSLVPGTLIISQATPSISISNIPSNAVNGGSFTPTYTYSGNGTPTESVTSGTTTVCTVSSGLVKFVGAGACSLTASATATTDYSAVTGSAQIFNVGGTGPAITASPSSINFGSVAVGSITLQSVTVSNTGKAAATISTPIISILKAGNADEFVVVSLCPSSLAAGKSCVITVTFVAGAYYNTPQTATLEVMDSAPGSPQPVALTATVLQPQAITFTTNPPSSAVYKTAFTVAATGGGSGNPVTFTSSGSCSNVGATYTMTSGTGACLVIANQAGNSNYSAALPAIKAVTATVAAQTITFTTNPPSSAPYNSSFTVGATASSGLAVTFTSSGSCSNNGATYTMTKSTGTCSVIANQAGNSNYSAAPPVTKAAAATVATQTIAFTTSPPSNAPYNSSFTVAATASSGLVVTFTSSGSCSNSGATYTMTKSAGTCSVTASQAGNSNYSAAPQVTKTVSASVATQTITFTTNPPASAAYKTSFTVAATASSGLAVTFTSSGTCSNSGATYTMTSGTGTCSVLANQVGNSNYSAAPQVAKTVAAAFSTATLTPGSMNFGTVSSGKTSSPKIATLTNTGTTPLIIGSIGFTGANPGSFTQTSTCPSSSSSLAAGKSCTISVTFKSGGTAVSASLAVTDNTQAGTQTVTVSGN